MNFSQLCVAGALTLEVLARGVNFVSALKHDASKESTTTRSIRKNTQMLKKKQLIQDDFMTLHDHRAIEEDVEMIWEESAVILESGMDCFYIDIEYSMSADGKTFAISCEEENSWTGRVRVYSLVDGQWVPKGPNLIGQNEGEYFGSSLALSIDGNIIAIGILGRSTEDLYGAGCIRVYEYDGEGWTPMGGQIEGQIEKEYFGGVVSLSGDGNIVAGSGISYYNNYSRGSVHVHEFDDGQWKQLGGVISGENNYDSLGFSLSLSDDGQVMAIGIPFTDVGYTDSGSFKVYQYDDVNGRWDAIGDTIHGDAKNSYLGRTLQISGDSTTVIAGATGGGGYVEVYRYNDNEIQWQQIGDNLPGLGIGRSVSLSSDGDTILVPNNRNEDNNMGVVRAYKYSGTQWDQLGQDIFYDNDDIHYYPFAALSEDGNTFIVTKKIGDVSVYTLTVASESPSISPSESPSISSTPSDTPSESPSLSSSPSETPSESPSISLSPSETPSNIPSISSWPSDTPSNIPSISSWPSETPSESPSISSTPSDTPSESPSISLSPSETPSETPSISSSPSDTPSETPSISLSPSETPSNIPSISSWPSETPSESPSISLSPSDTPSETPSISSSPSDTPSEFGLQEILIAHVNSTFAAGAVENGFVTLNTWYSVSSHVDTEKNVDVKLYTDQECNNEGIPAFLTQLDHTTHPAEEDGFKLVKSPKQINAMVVEGENDNTALFCEAIQVWSSEPDSGGKVINEVRVKYTLIADPTNGQFTFNSVTLNDSQDISQTLEIYPDATIDVKQCDGESALELGDVLCLQFTLSDQNLQDGLSIADIDELSLSLQGVIGFSLPAITEGGTEMDTELVTKKCPDGACEVNIFMYKDIFDRIPDDEDTATLEVEGRAKISRSGKNYDDTEGNDFVISVDLVNSGCEEEGSLLDDMGGLFSLIAKNINL